MIIFLGWALQAAYAGANEVSQPDSSGGREPRMELDFLINDDTRPTPATSTPTPMSTSTPTPRPGRAWIYWAAAGAAACGGLGWYWYEMNAEPTTTRNVQAFTDAQ